MSTSFMTVAGLTTAAIVLGAGVLHLIPKLGAPGRKLSEMLCRAPALDIVITYFTVAPLFVGPILAGWRGFFAGVVGQVAGVLIWTALHEAAHPEARKGPRIIKVTNRVLGRWRNISATWLTAVVTPVFWVVRVAEILFYPPLAALTGFPRYKSGDWVNVSRHKFSGLVGHDLIWCLYCDWMTGVWSLGTEILRNVESFWCPIRFASDKKCANCSVDFPDVNGGWVDARLGMKEVADALETQYIGTPEGGRSWFGHPARITVKGKPIDTETKTVELQTSSVD